MEVGEVAKQRMRRMGLLGPVDEDPVAVVERHLAMQAQDFGPAKWSIGQRLSGSTDDEVERAFSKGSFLRTHVMRPTWHFVSRRDLRWLMALTGSRVQKGLESRYRQLDLDARTRSKAERVITKALAGGNHLTRAELADVLRGSRIDHSGQRLPHLLSHCELESVICSGRVDGKQQTFALFEERVPKGRAFDRDRAVVDIVDRYLTGHGPATLKDMAWWSGLTLGDLRSGIEGLGDRVAQQELGGLTLWSIGDAPSGGQRKPRVQLLQTYDEFVVGYTESRYLGDPRADLAKEAFLSRNLPPATVLFGSRIAGRWRRSTRPKTVEVEVVLYERSRGMEAALEKATTALGRFVSKEVDLSITTM